MFAVSFALKSRQFGYDANAASFISTAGITDLTQQSAINTTVLALKAAGLWTKIYALYPMVGGTATTHKYNLINPATYTLTFNGTWTHSANGAFPNGSTGYATTGFTPSSVMTANNTSLFYFSRTDANNNSVVLGSTVSATQQLRIQARNAGSVFTAHYDATNQPTGAITDSLGLITTSKIASNDAAVFKGKYLVNRSTTCAGTLPNIQIYIGAANAAGTATNFTTRGTTFCGIAQGLTPTEVASLNAIAENYNYLLNRIPAILPNVIYEGDSFFAAGINIPAGINTYLSGAGYTVTSNNYAVSGATVGYVNGTNYMLYSSRTAAVSALRNANYFREILAFWEGTNEINFYLNGGSTAAQAAQSCYDNYSTYAQNYNQSSGTCVILNTVTPRTDASANAAFETARTTFNAQILADFTLPTSVSGVYRSSLSKWNNTLLCDVGNSAAMGYAGASNDTIYFNVDKVHPNSTGATYIANNYYGPAIIEATRLKATSIFN